MSDQSEELVTVFRSADETAEADATVVRDLLSQAGLTAEVLGDDAPGVIEGTFEVRVPASQAARAEELIAESEEDEEVGSESHDFDPVAVFSSVSVDAEMEAIAVRGVLDANGIPSVLAGNIPYPNLPFEVKVAKADVARAERALAEARAAGPLAAEEAEEAGEASEGAV
jgi:hypothetical protein